MPDPFKPPPSKSAAPRRLRDYMHLFREKTVEKENAARNSVAEFLDFSRKHSSLMEWIDRQADQHVKIDNNLLENTARANTFKEFRDHIRRLERDARSLAEGEQ